MGQGCLNQIDSMKSGSPDTTVFLDMPTHSASLLLAPLLGIYGMEENR